MRRMFNPPHSGKILRDALGGMDVTTAAKGAAPGADGPAAGSPSDGGTSGTKKEGEVIDAEYVDVDDKK